MNLILIFKVSKFDLKFISMDNNNNQKIIKITHPLIDIKLTKMRLKSVTGFNFRKYLIDVVNLMIFEIFKDYEVLTKEIETSTNHKTTGYFFNGEITIVPILRAGLGMINPFHVQIDNVKTGYIGLQRDEKTFNATDYYYKMPPKLHSKSKIYIIDPMLATGNSANYAINMLKSDGFTNIKLVSLIAAPEGIKNVSEANPNITIYHACLDQKLDNNKYIVPGLGDIGNRIFGTD